jgi:hypothetical protein
MAGRQRAGVVAVVSAGAAPDCPVADPDAAGAAPDCAACVAQAPIFFMSASALARSP